MLLQGSVAKRQFVAPTIDERTWPEVARRYVSASAVGVQLGLLGPKSTALERAGLSGQVRILAAMGLQG